MRSQSRGGRTEGEEDEEEEEGVAGAAWPWGTALPAPPATPQRQQALRASRASGHGSIGGGGPSARGRSCRPILLLPGRILHSLTPPRSSGTAPSCQQGEARQDSGTGVNQEQPQALECLLGC